jgi:hypothetical protein
VRRALVVSIAVLAGLVVLTAADHDRVALAQSCLQYDATGSWSTAQGNGYHPTFAFSQSGTSMSGTATLPGGEASRAGFSSNTGSVVGSLNGASLNVNVTWQKDDGAVTGNYTATVVPSSDTTGTLSGGSAGGPSWTGGGPLHCTQFSQPPPGEEPPPPEPFGESVNTLVTNTPAPGGSLILTSPQTVPTTVRTGDLEVSSSTGQIPGGTAVVAEGGSRAQRIGEAVAACWLIGPSTLIINNKTLANKVNSKKFKDTFAQLDAQGALRICMLLVTRANAVDNPPVMIGASTCRAKPLTFTIKRRKKKIVSIKVSTATPSKKHVRYSCTRTGGKLNIKAKRDRKGGLRKEIGKHLDVGAYRSPKAAASDANLAFQFKFPG